MIRALHHMADAPKALAQVKKVLRPGAIFILEFANKLNLKAILRYVIGRQKWSPFTLEPVEFVELNFDFHPRAIRNWLAELGFSIERILTVSHFRIGWMKRLVPPRMLAALDGLFQPTGAWFQVTPSMFVKAKVGGKLPEKEGPTDVIGLFKCPACGSGHLLDKSDHLLCPQCKSKWAVQDGIYDFRAKS
jgi:SAM-dependent methyltransferase